MTTYVAHLKYSRLSTVEIEASSLEEAQAKAQAEAEYQDDMMDINDGECVVLVEVQEVGE
jgi:hypothetical protein